MFSPSEPKLPFETWLAPHAHALDFLAGEHAEDLADVLVRLYRAVDAAFDSPPFNVWLHRVPGEDFHWHLELQPRTGYVAGLELGADVYINAITPETAARRLRDAGQ